jgi:hypothetical protein
MPLLISSIALLSAPPEPFSLSTAAIGIETRVSRFVKLCGEFRYCRLPRNKCLLAPLSTLSIIICKNR